MLILPDKGRGDERKSGDVLVVLSVLCCRIETANQFYLVTSEDRIR